MIVLSVGLLLLLWIWVDRRNGETA